MSALKEFANFITLNVANLAATYERLLIENGEIYQTLPADGRTAFARKLVKTVVEACEAETSAPLRRLFEERINHPPHAPTNGELPQPLLEVECLGQTLTPVITNLEAGKFFWQTLFEVRTTILRVMNSAPVPAPNSLSNGEKRDANKSVIEDRRVEEAPTKEYNLLRTLIDNLPDRIYVKDTESRFVLANTVTAHSLGVTTPEELIGKTDFDFFPAELATQYHADEQSVIHSGQPLLNREEPTIYQDGNISWASTTTMPLRDSQGQIAGLVGVSRDVTSQKQAEEALRLTQFTTDRAAIDVVWIGSDAKFLYVNDMACHSLGYSHEELLSMTVHDIQANPHSPEMWPAHWKELQERGTFTFETQHRRKNGEVFPVEITVNYIEFGNKEYNCAFFRNITKRKQLEQQIQESLERRARQVQTSTEVAQQVSAAAALDDLFRRVVNLVQAQFDYYHVQVYTLTEGDLVLQEGTGEAGRRMKEAGHKISLDAEKSLVVRAVWSGEPVLVPDTFHEPTWLPNALLPETKAELAVPITLGAEVVGVLDVQSDTVAGLNEEDQLLLVGLCGQIAVAIDNRKIEAERQRTEEKLAEERNLLRTVIDNIPDSIYVKDSEGRHLIVNKAMQDAGIGPLEEMLGKTDLDLYPSEAASQWYTDDMAVIQTGQPVINREELRFDGDKQQGWDLTTKVPLYDSQGKVVGLVGMSRDITEQKRAEEKLVEERNLLRALLDNLPDYIYIKDTESRFLLANEPMRQHLGAATLDEIIGKTDFDFSPRELAEQYYATEQAFLQAGQPLIGHEEPMYDHATDTRKWVSSTKVPFRDSQGQIVGLVGLNRDITPLKQAEAERERSLVEAEARLKEIQALQQISQDLAKTLQTKEILDILFQACIQVAGFEYVQVSLVDKEQRRIKGVAGVGVTESNLKKANRSLDEPDLLADIVRSGQTEILTGWDDRLDRAIFEAEGHANWVRVFAPVKLREETIGVVESGFNKSIRPTIQDFQLRLLQVFIDQTALALDNAQRYEANQKAAQRERTIREITDKLRAAPNLERLVEVAAKELGQHLSATHAKLELGFETSSAPNANGG